MSFLLDVVYVLACVLAAPWWLFRAATNGRFRRSLWERLGHVPDRAPGKRIWIHCASVGELNAARTFIEAARRRFPEHDCVISTYTETGRELARQRYGSARVFLFPLDFSWAVSRVLRRVKPAVLVLVELEFWPNMLRAARRCGRPVLVVNGRMEERSLRRWRRWRFLLKPVLDEAAPNLYCIQNPSYTERFRALGVPASRLRVTGTMKYDAVRADVPAAECDKLRQAFGIAPDAPVIIGGSTWPGEEEALLAAWRALRPKAPGLRLVLAPRHIERADEVARVIELAGFACIRRSQPDAARPADAVLLLDTLGELVAAYALASCAFVGKTLYVGGGHNVLEPAALGVPVLFGPLTQTCEAEAALLVERGAARRVASREELAAALAELMLDPAAREAMGRRGRELIREHQGATERNIAALGEILASNTTTNIEHPTRNVE